jgi:hypothetical protein
MCKNASETFMPVVRKIYLKNFLLVCKIPEQVIILDLEQIKNRQTDEKTKLNKVYTNYVFLLQSSCLGTKQSYTRKKGVAAFKSDIEVPIQNNACKHRASKVWRRTTNSCTLPMNVHRCIVPTPKSFCNILFHRDDFCNSNPPNLLL